MLDAPLAELSRSLENEPIRVLPENLRGKCSAPLRELPESRLAELLQAAAEIRFRPDGKFIYATIRGHDSVSVFAAGAHSGKLTFVQNISAGGKVPRGLGIDPTGRWLITANQKSDNAVEFQIDAATGRLSPTGQELKIGSPVDVQFVKGDLK